MSLQKPLLLQDPPFEVVEHILDLNCLLTFEPGRRSQPGLVSLKALATKCISMAKVQPSRESQAECKGTV